MKKHASTQGKAPSQRLVQPLTTMSDKALNIEAAQLVQGGDIRPGDIKHDTIIIPPFWP